MKSSGVEKSEAVKAQTNKIQCQSRWIRDTKTSDGLTLWRSLSLFTETFYDYLSEAVPTSLWVEPVCWC